MKVWQEPQPIQVSEALLAAVGGHPLVAEILARRGLTDPQQVEPFLHADRYTPAPPEALPDLEIAVERLTSAIKRGERILVWGDFDVDGQTATTVLVSTLRDLGARVAYHIPIRETESHGVKAPMLAKWLARGVDVLLTCDTGVAAHDAVALARERGVDVLITDHHELPPTLPDALAVVNPRRLPEDHPLSPLPGVGVAYKLAEALYARLGRSGEEAQLTDLAALGIVADVAPVVGEARYLLQRGLQRLRAPERLGLQALMRRANLDASWLTEEHIAFMLAPRLNALGRLADASVSVELLTTDDRERAQVLAAQLEGLNAQRQLMTRQMFRAALTQVERDPSLLDYAVLVLAHPSWPAGIIGIVASRLVEYFERPVILISSPPGQPARGSARSIPGINITAAIAAQKEMLHSFGGHPMAAGLSLDSERIAEFRQAISRTVRQMAGDGLPPLTLGVDAIVPLSDLSLSLLEAVEQLAPFGPSHPAPVFVSPRLRVVGSSAIGRDREHLRVTVADEAGATHTVIWWQGADWPLPEGVFDLAYTPRSTTYRGQRQIQIEWIDARVVEAVPVELRPSSQIEVIDCRRSDDPLADLRRLVADEAAAIWAEGLQPDDVDAQTRRHLGAAETLVIWTAPPDRRTLQRVLARVRPRRAIVFALDPGIDELQRYLERLAGMVKYALRARQGLVQPDELAAALGQTEAVVEKGIEWLAARGYIDVVAREDGRLTLRAGGQDDREAARRIASELAVMLKEVAAYRAYFRRADASSLFL